MNASKYGFRDELLARVSALADWFQGALKIYEGRDEQTVSEAIQAFLRWTEIIDDEDKAWALVYAWISFEEERPRWADKDEAFAEDFPLNAEPPWLFTEYQLVAGLVMAGRSLDLLQGASKEGFMVAAMLYADAVQARADWLDLRGLKGSRNPHPKVAEAYKILSDSENRLIISKAVSQEARRKAQRRVALDPKQAARAEAFKLWQERHAGKHPKLRTNEQFATEVMRQWPVLTSSKVICGWCTKWNNEAKTQPAS